MHPQGRNKVEDGKRAVSCCARKSPSGDGEETDRRAVASDAAPARVPVSKGQDGTGRAKRAAKGSARDQVPAKPT